MVWLWFALLRTGNVLGDDPAAPWGVGGVKADPQNWAREKGKRERKQPNRFKEKNTFWVQWM